jgi:ribosome-binding protein aMBF1 (putative translation factor)
MNLSLSHLSLSLSQRLIKTLTFFVCSEKNMSLQTEINEVIQNRKQVLGMSNYKLAKLMKIAPQYLGQLLDNDEDKHRWNVVVLERAFDVLGIKVTYKAKKVQSASTKTNHCC